MKTERNLSKVTLWENWLGEVRVLLQTKIGVLVEKCPILYCSPSFI